MLKILGGVIAMAALAGTASAIDTNSGDLVMLGYAGDPTIQAGGPIYSNTTNFLSSAFAQGGAADQSGNVITKMMMDDINFHPFHIGKTVTAFTFSVYNANTAAVSARARVRFWKADGAGGGPGTYYNDGVNGNIGYTFNAFSFSSGVTLLTGTIAVPFTLTTNHLWAGITFDNNTGATGATLAQLNNFGQGLFDPPTVGTSADQAYLTSAAGSFFTTNNPAGSLFNFGGAPVANFGWEFVPAPGSVALLAFGGLVATRRRR